MVRNTRIQYSHTYKHQERNVTEVTVTEVLPEHAWFQQPQKEKERENIHHVWAPISRPLVSQRMTSNTTTHAALQRTAGRTLTWEVSVTIVNILGFAVWSQKQRQITICDWTNCVFDPSASNAPNTFNMHITHTAICECAQTRFLQCVNLSIFGTHSLYVLLVSKYYLFSLLCSFGY